MKRNSERLDPTHRMSSCTQRSPESFPSPKARPMQSGLPLFVYQSVCVSVLSSFVVVVSASTGCLFLLLLKFTIIPQVQAHKHIWEGNSCAWCGGLPGHQDIGHGLDGGAYILKGGFCGHRNPQTIWNFRRKIVWERKKYQDYTVCRAIDNHFPNLYLVIAINCQ